MMDWASRWCRCWYLLGALLCLNKGDSLHSCITATTPHMVGAFKPKRDGISQYLKGVFISFSFWLSAMKAASLKEVATWWLDWPILIQQICLVFILSPGIKLDAPTVLHSIHEEPGLELLSLGAQEGTSSKIENVPESPCRGRGVPAGRLWKELIGSEASQSHFPYTRWSSAAMEHSLPALHSSLSSYSCFTCFAFAPSILAKTLKSFNFDQY